MSRRRSVCASVVLVGVVGLTAAGGSRVALGAIERFDVLPDSGDSVTTRSSPEWEPEPIEWVQDSPGVAHGWLEVPIDYGDPGSGSFRLYLVRNAADRPADRIGTLVVNPGGPGVGGSFLAEEAELFYGAALLERFDIVGWDPRGTGRSVPAIDCIDDYDAYYAGFDTTPETESEHQRVIGLAEDFATQCVDNNPGILGFVGTDNSARDIDSIRRALGEEQISYYGLSYGAELGATWATLFPDTVRAAVLDGATDPDAGLSEATLQQAVGFETALATFLDRCSSNPACAFHNGGDAEGAFDALMSRLDAEPLPTEPGRPMLDLSVALWGVITPLVNEELGWPDLEAALAAAAHGDGTALLALFDRYHGRQPGVDGWDNMLEAQQTIRCMDSPQRLTVEQVDAAAPRYIDAAPRLAPLFSGWYFCTFFPAANDPRVEIDGTGAGPIVVCGTTGDPSTPLQGSRKMAEALEDGRLIVIDANKHLCRGADPCADALIEEYLIELRAPPAESEC